MSTEAPLEFITPLKDTTVTEKETVCLECEVNKPGVKATWLKDGKKIFPRKGCKISADDKRHRLILDSAVLDDNAEYMIKLNGQSCIAKLTVEGSFSYDVQMALSGDFIHL